MLGKAKLHCALRKLFLRTAMIALVLIMISEAYAQDSKYAGAFLEIPVGGRALSMGGAYTGIADDESAFHWNPAGVSLMDHKYLGMMYSSEFGIPGSALANFFHLGFTLPLENVSIAANWVRLAVGDLSHTPDLTGINITAERERMVRDALAGSQDLFSDTEDAFVLSIARDNKFILDWGWLYYAHPVEVPIGVNFKYIRQKVGTFGQAQGIGVDAGIMLRFSLGDYLLMPFLGKLALAVNVTDIGGTKLVWSTERPHTIPMRIVGGASYAQDLPFINTVVTLAGDFTVHESEKPRLGIDFTYLENISVRAGLNKGFFATGAGFVWEKRLKVDYSLSLHDLGPEHRLSFGVDIDNFLKYAFPAKE
ncbi:MAG: UPF0164 family protein [Candidatus Kapaibacterium sp.]